MCSLRSLTATLMLCGFVAQVHAEDQPADYVSIECDAAHGSLLIEKHRSASASEIPHGRWIRALNDMVGSRPLPRDDGVEFPTNDLERACKIGKARYVVRLHAVIFGSHVLGRCGAADPGVEVSVRRNELKVLDKFLMVDNCGDTGTSGLDVSTLEFLEPAHAMRLNAMLDDESKGLTPLTFTYDLESINDLTLQKVWGSRPVSSQNIVTPPAE
jgi:hypothetical protein